MPFPIHIQFYIHKNRLTEEQVRALSQREIETLYTEFSRDNRISDTCMILENPLFQALLATGEVSFDMDLELIRIQEYALVDHAGLVEFRVQLQELHELIEQHAGPQTRLKHISFQDILSFVDYKALYMRGVLTLDEIFSLSFEHIRSLNRLENVVDEGLDAEQKPLNRMVTREEQIASRIDDMLHENIISKQDMIDFPVITHTSPSLCALIINGKISLKQAQLLTAQQKINMSGYNTYYLIWADIMTVKQVLMLTRDQIFYIERLNLREVKADPVIYQTLERVVQEEAVQYLKNTKSPQTSQSFMLFNQTMMGMERRHINTHVWHQIKERVATRMWDKYHFLFLSQSDPGFIERIDAGQNIKLARSSEVQALLANSEGYRQYGRHTMFSSRFFRPVMSAQEESSGYEIAPMSVS